VRNPVPLPFQSFLARFRRSKSSKAMVAPVTRQSGFKDASQLRAGGTVRIQQVTKNFGPLKVLDGIDLVLPAGSVTAILGPSGSGKSTLLRTINHLERVDSGFIAIDGELVGYSQKGATLYELKSSVAPISAWCSKTSISSHI
jgi:polar amino acid transport system permease protein